MGLTMPLVGAGTAAVKMAADHEKSMRQIKAQAGVASDAMGDVEQSIDDIRTTTGHSTQELQDAMTLAQSSALDTAEANELVKTSAMAAAAGFGDMRNMVNLATTAKNKFGDEVKSASDGLETVIATADQVQAQMDQFVPSFLKATGGMQQLNISMGEGAALFGKLADSARNTKAAGTQYAQLLKQLNNPQADLRNLLEDTFGSMEQFRQAMGNNAIQAFKTFQSAVKNSDKNLGQLLGRQRAVTGATNLFAGGMERANEILDKQQSRQDLIQKKFQQTDSILRTLSIAWEELKIAMRPLGEEIIPHLQPMLKSFISNIRSASQWFQNLSDSSQKTVLAIGAITAAVGPVLIILGTLVSSISALIPVVTGLVSIISGGGSALVAAFGALLSPIGLVISAIVASGAGILWAFGELDSAAKAVSQLLTGDFSGAWETASGIVSRITDDIVGYASDTYRGVKKWLLDKFMGIVNGIRDGVDRVTGYFQGMYETIVGGSIVPDLINETGDYFQKLPEKMGKPTKRATSGVVRTFKSSLKDLIKGETTLEQAGKRVLNRLEDKFAETTANMALKVANFKDSSSSDIKKFQNTFEKSFSFLKRKTVTVVDAIRNIFRGAYSLIETGAVAVAKSFKNIWVSVGNRVLSVLQQIAEAKAFGQIGSIVSAVINVVLSLATGGLSTLISVGSSLAGAGSSILSWLGSLFGGFFATGGVVPGRKGEEKLIMAHGQERVVPPGETVSNGGTHKADIKVFLDSELLGEKIGAEITDEVRVRTGVIG